MKYNTQLLFGPEGLLADKLEGYENREEQATMAETIYNCLIKQEHGIIEAGTGVGKSLAYLVPAICYALEYKKRVIIATNTINLQEQLYQKDIPFLKEILPVDFNVALFKGRSNYLCLRRLHELNLGLTPQQGLITYLETINLWAQNTVTGDRSEAKPAIPNQIWQEINCQKENCAEEACGFFKRCYYWQLRRSLTQSQIIVTNHALLLADLQTDNSVLPSYDTVIIDEAHNLEDVATNTFSHQLYPQTIGVYYRSGLQLYYSLRATVPILEVEEYRQLLEDLIAESSNYFKRLQTQHKELTQMITESNVSLYRDTRLLEIISAISQKLDEFALDDELASLRNQFREYTNQLRASIELILAASDRNYVFWAELVNSEARLQAAPLSVGKTLQETLFTQAKTVIMTSATLATNQNFDYFKNQIGLNSAVELLLGSPFDYSKQALLCVPKNIKNPKHPYYDHHVAYFLLHVIARTKGGVLGLFTSYQAMETTADLIAAKLEEEGYSLFVQGDDSRQQLLEDFLTTPQAVLLGTNSFWEGVDIPGNALRAVVIARLPFAVPERPIIAARLRAIEEAGGNSFQEYSVPQAILRLKQGFGRLIRTKADRGAVVILDDRFLTASYGQQFRASLPPARFTRDLDELRNYI